MNENIAISSLQSRIHNYFMLKKNFQIWNVDIVANCVSAVKKQQN